MNKRLHRSSMYLLLSVVPAVSAGDADVQELEPLKITASPFKGHSDLELSQPADILSGDELMLHTKSTLGETVEQQLGVTASDFNPVGASRPVIRGLGGQRVMILENRQSSMDVSDISADHAVSIQPVLARQVEILKGPSTLLYGSGAIGGIVNVVNDRIPETIPDGLEGAFEGRFSSATTERTGAFRITGSPDNKFALHADAMYLRTDDYDAASGTVENSDVETGQWAVGGSYIGNSGWMGLSVSQYYDKYGIPVETGADELPFIDMRQTRVNLKSRLDDPFAGLSGLNFNFAYGDYKHTEFENPDEPGTIYTNNEVDTGLVLEHKPFHDWTGALGIQGGSRDLQAEGEEAFIPATQSWNIAGFLVEERDFGAWHLELGARVEHKAYNPEEGVPDTGFTPYSLMIGTVWRFVEGYDMRINAARAQRAPHVQELYADGPHVATQTFEIGNADLSVETSNNIDLSINKTSGKWQWSLGGFYNYIQNYIYLQEVDTNGDGIPDLVDEEGELEPDGPFLLVFEEQQNANFYGIEAETTYRLMENRWGELDGRLWGDYVRAEFTSGGNVPRMPPWRIGGNIEYRKGAWTGGLDVFYTGEQIQTAELETSTPGYTMLNINLIYKVPVKGVDFSLYARGTNLLNEDARRSTSFLKDVAPLPGRSATIGIRGDF